MANVPSTKVLPLGGIEEFGNNSLVIEYADSAIIIDFGLKFVRKPSYGVDYLIPDTRYLKNNAKKIKGIVFTHGHLDHIGGVHLLLKELNIPMYASKFTALLLHKMLENAAITHYDLTVMQLGEKIVIDDFTIEPVSVDHSIPDAVALVIRTRTGLLIHSGDFKSDYEPYSSKKNLLDMFDSYRKEGVLALFSDSTNSVKPGRSTSEMEVYRNLENIYKKYKRRLIFSTFSTQIGRIRKILDLAVKYDRVVFFLGKSMLTNLSIAIKGELLDQYESVIKPLKNYKSYRPEQAVLIATGSQGEENSALIKLATKQHRQIRLDSRDVIVLSSSVIPGNELTVSGLINTLIKNGNEVLTNDDAPIHTSGHGCADELSLLIKNTKPKFFFPVHGNYVNLKTHKDLACKQGIPKENVFLIENGQKIEIFPNNVKLLEKVRLTGNFIERGKISVSDENTFINRKRMGEEGVIFIYICLAEQAIKNIWIEGVGVLNAASEERTWNQLSKYLKEVFKTRIMGADLKLRKKIEKVIRTEAKKFLTKMIGFTPIVRVRLDD